MPPGIQRPRSDQPAILRWTRYAFYDWTKEMPRSRRALAGLGLFLQGYALWAAVTGSLIWPFMWPHGIVLMDAIWLMFVAGGMLMNAMLTSEFLRKTQLEADLTAARQIQQTLQPQTDVVIPGYIVETTYRPFRGVGGDYFDIVELPGQRALLAIADVAGKGMPAALLAANVQALVRTIPSIDTNPATLARRINEHLSRYTPGDRFVTAVFIVLDQISGDLTYVNAGHNPPIVSDGTTAGTAVLEATGVPLGLFAESQYDARSVNIPPRGALAIFTDGLADSIRDDNPEARIRAAMASNPSIRVSDLMNLVDRQLNEDDVTVVLVKRH